MAADRMKVLTTMMDQGVIPVFYHPDVEVCKKVIQACANGGAKCIEFTNRGDFAAHVFFEVTRHFAKADPSVIMGVGSIVDAPTAGIYIANGAKFVVGPAAQCRRRQGLQPPQDSLQPGLRLGDARSATPRNSAARSSRSSPAARSAARSSSRAMLGPCPWTRIMPTGGVEPHRGVAAQVVRRRHRLRRHRLQPDHQGSCSTRRTTPASRRRCATTIALIRDRSAGSDGHEPTMATENQPASRDRSGTASPSAK